VYNTADGGSRHHILAVDSNIYHYEKLGSHTEGTLESNFIIHNTYKTKARWRGSAKEFTYFNCKNTEEFLMKCGTRNAFHTLCG
jgi:hypothetical protein